MCDIGKKMYDRRKELGLTLEEVGNAVGVGKSTVRRWENGMIKNMGRDKIAALAKVLQMNPVEFVPSSDFKLKVEVNMDEAVRKVHKMNQLTDESEGMIQKDDWVRLEALHQNPRLGMLFDHSRKMKKEDVEFMIQMAERILNERDEE